MEHQHGAVFSHGDEAAQLGILQLQGPVGSPGDFRMGVPQVDEPPVIMEQAAPLLHHGGRGGFRLAAVVRPGRVGNRIPVSPAHGQPAVGVRIRAAPGSPQADFLSVVDERRSGTQDIQAGRHPDPSVGVRQIARGPVRVMIGDEGHQGRVRPAGPEPVQAAFHIPGIHVHVPGRGGGGNQALRLGHGEVETVHGGNVLIRHRVAVPDLAHHPDIRRNRPELPRVPFPEGGGAGVIAEIDILGGIEAEPVHPQVQIEPGDFQRGLPHRLVVIIQLRHALAEIRLIPEFRGGDGIIGMPGLPFLRPAADIPVVIKVFFIVHQAGVAELPEPVVGGARMIQRQIQDQPDPPLMAAFNQIFQILHGAEGRIDGIIIRHVVFVIGNGLKHRGQPDALDAQACFAVRVSVVQVIQPVQDSPQIPGPVPVAVGEGSGEDFVEYKILGILRGFRHSGGQQRQKDQRQAQDRKQIRFHGRFALLSFVVSKGIIEFLKFQF